MSSADIPETPLLYLGHLPHSDPLYGYLRHAILPQLGVSGTEPDFRVFRITASNHVYVYEERRSGTRLVGKFYGGLSNRSTAAAGRRMEREYDNLHHLRGQGFTGYPHYIVRPLGRNAELGCVLVQEYCWGTPLTDFLVNAITHGAHDALYQKLTALAWFLALLHNRTARVGTRVDFGRHCAYFDHLVAQLRGWGHLAWEEDRELAWLKDRWREKGCMWEDNRVLVHGDVTPANILFGDHPWVIALDLERMQEADRVFDVGRLAAEIKHFFMQYTGDRWRAEPFIGHFLWEYACHFHDRETAFASITRRVPFHMGMTLLRIARNSWITDGYRRQLIKEAKQTLR